MVVLQAVTDRRHRTKLRYSVACVRSVDVLPSLEVIRPACSDRSMSGLILSSRTFPVLLRKAAEVQLVAPEEAMLACMLRTWTCRTLDLHSARHCRSRRISSESVNSDSEDTSAGQPPVRKERPCV